MPHLLFRLRGVPEDEAEDIRRLLHEHAIDFYETSAGNWGISMPGIWTHDGDVVEKAKSLIADYEVERGEQMQAEYQQLRSEGRQRRLIDLIIDDPMKFILYLAGILLVLYLSVMPFLSLGS
ncbi:hypothetical protein BOW53_12240 [Solemya pervernicosa gill symbiont]|uniref:DUF2007 domain-containing protein n=2 Tax=Gammaproteobacteria incertae sedis TaxID=118884 RepID=A0A1T2L2I3_9GAMM|nr:DUF6164 family protein [Candidatus Reidiella endopervernicosa]OOZ39318.1 hypothetical protein BOW53_12240 [Solemya pervernicosa gill symbiont]QKQ25496.1 hypothetical protein HUE57_03670 [Candidatus Reidiella endopervernicosa]